LRICKHCKKEKSIEDFTRNRAKKDGLNIYCRACCTDKLNYWKQNNKSLTTEYKKRYRDLNRKEIRDYGLRYRYGINSEQFDKIFESQGRLCAICGSDKSDSRNFVVDHNHKTGNIRGILCSYCNRGLGIFKDDVDIMTRAILYLKKENSNG